MRAVMMHMMLRTVTGSWCHGSCACGSRMKCKIQKLWMWISDYQLVGRVDLVTQHHKRLLGQSNVRSVWSISENVFEGCGEFYGDETSIIELPTKNLLSGGRPIHFNKLYSISSFWFGRYINTPYTQWSRSCWLRGIEIHFGNRAWPAFFESSRVFQDRALASSHLCGVWYGWLIVCLPVSCSFIYFTYLKSRFKVVYVVGPPWVLPQFPCYNRCYQMVGKCLSSMYCYWIQR